MSCERPLRMVSAVDAVISAIEEDIFSLRFVSGSKITESDLVSRYGVSRNTIREAIAHLLANGILEKIANRGVYVKVIRYDDVEEIFRLRKLFELEAIRAMGKMGFIPFTLMQALERVEKLNFEKDWRSYVEADMNFHSTLIDSVDSPRLSRLYASLSAEVKLCITCSSCYPFNHMCNPVRHSEIIEQLENDRPDKAAEMLSIHLDAAVENFRNCFLADERPMDKEEEPSL